MRLQKATRFALYAVLELARDPARRLSASDIAQRYGISVNHLAKVMRELARARLVEGERGAAGGYRFAANAKRTTLMDIVSLFEPLGPAAGEPGGNSDIGQAMAAVLSEIDEITQATLRSISIDTLLRMITRHRAAAA